MMEPRNREKIENERKKYLSETNKWSCYNLGKCLKSNLRLGESKRTHLNSLR